MATTTNFGWETPDDTDLVKDGALAMRTLGNAIDTSLVDLKGGTTGQNLRKNTNTDMDFVWAGDATNTVIDAEGDLLVGDSADTLQRLAIGTTGQVLTVDTTIDGKIKWAAPAGGGKVLQVVQGTYSTSKSITSQTFTDTDLSASITPSDTSSKILVLVSQTFSTTRNDENCRIGVRLLRSSTTIFGDNSASAGQYTLGVKAVPSTVTGLNGVVNFAYLDSPSTTSSTTYKTQYSVDNTSITATAQPNSITSSIILMEIGA